MMQPAWDENTWGYDTVQSPYRQGPIYAENDYTLLDQPGEWYQDATAGVLYYIPMTGQDLTTVDVELPQLQLTQRPPPSTLTSSHDLISVGSDAKCSHSGMQSDDDAWQRAIRSSRPASHRKPAPV